MRKWHSRRDTRKIHRWGAFLVSLPFLIVIISGLLLQVKKEVEWIQPSTEEVAIDTLALSFSDILIQQFSDKVTSLSLQEGKSEK